MDGKEPLVAILPADIPPVVVPILFFPGMMATRLKKPGGEDIIWDPDSLGWMLKKMVIPGFLGRYKKIRNILGITIKIGGETVNNEAEPIRKDQSSEENFYDKTQLKRGFAECFSSFKDILKKMDKEFFTERRSIIEKLNIYAPVEVLGYDWRDEPDKIVEYVKGRIKEELEGDEYLFSRYGNEFKFIIVTHSMGGLIARKLLQENKDLEERCLGVIHGNQPAVGSPKFYAYFKKGATEVNITTIAPHNTLLNPAREGGLLKKLGSKFKDSFKERALSAAIGKEAIDFQYIASGAPGSLILLPTNDYAKKKWLTWDFKKNGPVIEKIKKAIKDIDDTDYAERGEINLNKSIYDYYRDGYDEYGKVSGYIGLLNKDFKKKYGIKIFNEFFKSLKSAENFHKEIGEGDNLYTHQQTYEISSNEYNTVQGVKLTEKDKEIIVPPSGGFMVKEFHAELDFSYDGDGTVPLSSQRALSDRYKAEGFFSLNKKVPHQDSYNAKEIMDYTCDTIEEILLRQFSSVYFAQDSSEINDENKKRLERLIDVIIIKDNEGRKYNYTVTGYASYEGDADYNLRLSKERADSVKKYLVDKLSERKLKNETKSKEERKKEYEKRFEIKSKGATIKDGEQRNQETRVRWRRVDIRREGGGIR
jgi:outer membrane protein OmpA-like peptidoglycan-associated protein